VNRPGFIGDSGPSGRRPTRVTEGVEGDVHLLGWERSVLLAGQGRSTGGGDPRAAVGLSPGPEDPWPGEEEGDQVGASGWYGGLDIARPAPPTGRPDEGCFENLIAFPRTGSDSCHRVTKTSEDRPRLPQITAI